MHDVCNHNTSITNEVVLAPAASGVCRGLETPAVSGARRGLDTPAASPPISYGSLGQHATLM